MPQPVAPIMETRRLTQKVAGPEGELVILHEIDLAVAPGEALAIVGPSGAGKSTLLGLLAGLDTPSEGEIHLLGERLDRLDEDGRARVRAGQVGFVFQSFQLIDGLTALENVLLPLELAGVTAAAARAASLLEQVGLTPRARHYPRQLSGGEQQRVALARAFAGEPRVLFADEPTGNLDSVTGQRVIELLFALRERHGSTLVLVTHDAQLAARCDRRVRIAAGQLSEELAR
ncbi:MAG: ATP-binding cassette domain-containing protein [Halothiobacillaceae bacterium]|nr:ATP-binding cassette domain-containing protein [Halothiobacillaceae bacterium]MDY0049545.1 ATP-binding cassette domain-containing protein [Halothiobacillaceae bacterium]